MVDFKPPEPFNFDIEDSGSWPKWKQRFEIFLLASGKDQSQEKVKIALLLHIIGGNGLDIYNTFPSDKTQTLDDVLSCFDLYFLPKQNIAMESFKFNSIVQREDQSIDSFITELRKQAANCAFVCMKDNCKNTYVDRMIKDRIILGIYDKQIQQRLIKESDMTLEKIQEYCKSIELSEKHNIKMLSPLQMERVDAVKFSQKCRRCDTEHLIRQCPAFGKTCAVCQKKGHYTKMCFLRNENNGTSHFNRSGYSSGSSSGGSQSIPTQSINVEEAAKTHQTDEPLGSSSLFGNSGKGTGRIRHTQPQLRTNAALENVDMDRRPTSMSVSTTTVKHDKETEELCKKVRSMLKELTPQNFDTVVNQIRQLRIDTKEKLQKVINLVFEKVVAEPNSVRLYAMKCKEIQSMQVPAGDGKESVTFRTLVVSKCQQDFENIFLDESGRRAAKFEVKEFEDWTDPSKKKELQEDLEEYDRGLRMKSVGTIGFIGELFNQQMLSASIMRRCLQTMLDNKDEESLEALCVLLRIVGKRLESRNVDLSRTFDEMKRISDGKRHKISSRLRFMLQEIIDLRKSKWPQADEPLGSSSLFGSWGKKTGGIRDTQPTLGTYATLEHADMDRRPTPMSSRGSNDSYSSSDLSMERNSYKNQDRPVRDSGMSGRLRERGEPTPSYSVSPSVSKRTEEQFERRIRVALDEWLSGSVKSWECFRDVAPVLSSSDYSKVVYESYNYILDKTRARLETTKLFAEPIETGSLSVEDVYKGLEELFSLRKELVLNIPHIYPFFAEDLFYLIAQEVLPFSRLHKLLNTLIQENVAKKVLKHLFALIMEKKEEGFLRNIWKKSGLQLSDFMPASEVRSFTQECNVAFLLGVNSSADETFSVSYEVIQEKLTKILESNASFDDIVNWIWVNVGDRVKEEQFIRALSTAIFENSISKNKLKIHVLSSHAKLIQKYVDASIEYELQCLYALQSLIHKLNHPRGLLLAICDKLYEDSIISQESFIAWESNSDPGEQEGKGAALKQLTWFFTQLKENEEEDEYSSNSEDA